MNQITILGAGFIGLNLVKTCLDQGIRVRVLDRCPCPPPLLDRLEWIQKDFADHEAIAHALRGSQVVFHMISSTVPGDKISEEDELYANVIPTIHCLRSCVANQVERIVFLSSASVYGDQAVLPISESALPCPISIHGIQKLLIEQYLHYFMHEYGLKYRIMRLSNPYGSGQNIYGRQGLVSIIIGSIASGKPLMIHGDGQSIRDYVHIDDVVSACLALAEDQCQETVYNIGSGEGHSVIEMVRRMEAIIGCPIPTVYDMVRTADIPASVLDIGRAARNLNYAPQVELDEGLKRTLAEYGLSNRS